MAIQFDLKVSNRPHATVSCGHASGYIGILEACSGGFSFLGFMFEMPIVVAGVGVSGR